MVLAAGRALASDMILILASDAILVGGAVGALRSMEAVFVEATALINIALSIRTAQSMGPAGSIEV